MQIFEFKADMSTPPNTKVSNIAPASLPDVVMQAHQCDWTLSGEGIFSWTVFRFYRARLFVMGERYRADAPHVLDLEYLRSLLASQIVSIAMDEIKRLRACDDELLSLWSDRLLSFLPDVSLGDRLIGVFTPGIGVSFYSADTFLGEINDPIFAEAFAAIWLAPETKAEQLRLALLGQTGQTSGVRH